MNRQPFKTLCTTGSLILAGMASGQAVAADTASASVTATVIAPISVVVAKQMVMGNLVPGNGIVTLAPNGTRSASGDTPLSTSGPTPQGAEFDISGTGDNTFSIDYTGSSTSLVSDANSMPIAFIIETGPPTGKTATNSNPTTGALSGGSEFIAAGAAVTVAADQAEGTYSGTLVVTLAYY